MMYPMVPTNNMFPVMGDDMGFVPNGYAGMTMVPPPPPSHGGDYTMDLEAELNHLKEEKACMKIEELLNSFIVLLNKTILLTKQQMLVEKMMELSKENVNPKKGGL
ncbi:hypothetical protein VPH35_054055 [Triticum aestivum]|uniref:Uncharacterized protein n=1 Tax=Triticum turgidum subsp. durum TaxID=4567 RepID=A0A9R1QSR7_TRITD|nr:unnamed protein product [Triticum turgidum subsp. durum]